MVDNVERLKASVGLVGLGALLAAIALGVLRLTGAWGPEGAVMVTASGSVAFLPISGALFHYLMVFAFGIIGLLGVGCLLYGLISIPYSLIVLVRDRTKKREAR